MQTTPHNSPETLQLSVSEDLGKAQRESPPTEVPNADGVG